MCTYIYLEDYFVKLLMLAVLPSDKREDLLGTRPLHTASMSSGKCTVLLCGENHPLSWPRAAKLRSSLLL
jgi:hypothetical protein